MRKNIIIKNNNDNPVNNGNIISYVGLKLNVHVVSWLVKSIIKPI